jgi:hypothetical protein
MCIPNVVDSRLTTNRLSGGFSKKNRLLCPISKLHMKPLRRSEEVLKDGSLFEYVLGKLRRIRLNVIIFWDIALCSPNVNRRFGRNVSRPSSGHPKRQFTYGLHSAISQKMATFITTAVRTSNPTCISLVGLFGHYHA